MLNVLLISLTLIPGDQSAVTYFWTLNSPDLTVLRGPLWKALK